MGIDVHPISYQNMIVKDDPGFNTKEIQGEVFEISDLSDKDEIVTDLDWCKAEFQERISRDDCNPGEAWKLRREMWKKFMQEGKHDYTYAERMKYQLDPIIEELKRNPDTRQAIIEIHNNKDDIENLGGKKRIPCSLSYSFMIRKDEFKQPKLNMIYHMRSCDFYNHFVNDIWLADELKKYIAKEVRVKDGTLTMFINSLHMYQKDMESNIY